MAIDVRARFQEVPKEGLDRGPLDTWGVWPLPPSRWSTFVSVLIAFKSPVHDSMAGGRAAAHPPGGGSRRWLGLAGLVRAEASMAASAYQGRFFCVSRPAPVVGHPSRIVHTIHTHRGGESSVTKVYLRQGESPENLLKRFRKRVTRDRILSDARKKRYFVSKSEQRRIAKRKAQRKERRRRWKQQRWQGRN